MKIVFRPVAKTDVAEVRDWYDRTRLGLGDEFLTALETELTSISAAPRNHAPVYQEVRRARVGKFPYTACTEFKKITLTCWQLCTQAATQDSGDRGPGNLPTIPKPDARRPGHRSAS